MRKIFIAIAVFVGVCLHAQASRVFYYHNGERIFLDKVENTQIVRFKETAIASQRDYIHSLMELADYTIVRINLLTYKVTSTVALNRNDGVIAAMKANENILYVSDLLMYRDSTLQWTGNRMNVRIYPGSDLRDILQINRIPFVSFKRQVGFNQETYSVELGVTKNSAIDYANRLSETGSVVWAAAPFWRLISNCTHTNSSYQHLQQIQQLHNNNNPLFYLQWGLLNTGQHGGIPGVDINVVPAWNITSGAGVRVAVLDDGIDLTHPDLKGNLLPGYDATDGRIGGMNGGAYLGNPDYCYKFEPGYTGQPLCDIGNPHGTACAGIIAAKNNDIGIKGIAYSANIIPIRIGYTISGPGPGRCVDSNVMSDEWTARSIYKAWSYFGADILSISWGGGSPDQALTDAINDAVKYGRNSLGSLLIFAAGNTGVWGLPWIIYPANLPNVMAVGAITPTGQRKYSSNFGTELDIVAPGVLIPTTDIQGCMGYSIDDYFLHFGYTSAATPHVAGVAALILSVNPNLMGQEVRDIIEYTARRVNEFCPINNPNGYVYEDIQGRYNGTWNMYTGHGLVDAYAAVRRALCTEVFRNESVTYTQDITSCGNIYIQDITISNGATLTLNAVSNINVQNVTIAENSRLILYAGNEVVFDGYFEVHLGAEFEIR